MKVLLLFCFIAVFHACYSEADADNQVKDIDKPPASSEDDICGGLQKQSVADCNKMADHEGKAKGLSEPFRNIRQFFRNLYRRIRDHNLQSDADLPDVLPAAEKFGPEVAYPVRMKKLNVPVTYGLIALFPKFNDRNEIDDSTS